MKKLLAVLLCLSLSLSGCGLAQMATLKNTRDNLSKLNVKMTTELVRQIMGTPYSTETVVTADNKTAVVWNYDIGQTADPVYGLAHRVELTPLVFVDNLLIGWGANYYEKIVAPNAQKETLQLNIKHN